MFLTTMKTNYDTASKAGVQKPLKILDSGLRQNDEKCHRETAHTYFSA
jgi:hypothetical protein